MGGSGKDGEFSPKQKNLSNNKRWIKMIGAFVGDVGSSLLILGPLFYTFTHSTHAGGLDHLASESFQLYVSRSLWVPQHMLRIWKVYQSG